MSIFEALFIAGFLASQPGISLAGDAAVSIALFGFLVLLPRLLCEARIVRRDASAGLRL
jgi:hypothetical protein